MSDWRSGLALAGLLLGSALATGGPAAAQAPATPAATPPGGITAEEAEQRARAIMLPAIGAAAVARAHLELRPVSTG